MSTLKNSLVIFRFASACVESKKFATTESGPGTCTEGCTADSNARARAPAGSPGIPAVFAASAAAAGICPIFWHFEHLCITPVLLLVFKTQSCS